MKFLQSTIERLLYGLLFLIFAVVIYFAFHINENNHRTHEILLSTCNAGNEFRNDNRKLWDYILNLQPEQPPTPEQQKRIDDFKAFLDETFMNRDCSKI